MSVAVRIVNLTMSGLAAAERHGKRKDEIAIQRTVRDAEPIVAGSLDLREAFDAHAKGARRNCALKKPIAHAVIQFDKLAFPISADPVEADRMRATMLALAIWFINETHGGRAVFSGRYDRHERGEHVADVFFSPLFEKSTKRGRELWISTTRDAKALCHRHREEIERRFNKVGFNTSPRACAMALQSELRAFLARQGYAVKPKREKMHGAPDRKDPETIAARNESEKVLALANERLAEASQRLAAAKAESARIAALASTLADREKREAEGRAKQRAEQERRLADAVWREALAFGVEAFDGDPGADEIVVGTTVEALGAIWDATPANAPRPTAIRIPPEVATGRPTLLTRALRPMLDAARFVILAVETGFEDETAPHAAWLATLRAPVRRVEIAPGGSHHIALAM